ncbi:hypothetical protein DR864_19005 [Runella rosea]|uniref:Uncharacterized protein n=1 Tax=Runella rosea TaxID=2259595 RepID=A0A344TM04_9BACT|nr:hypothetical protein [Runella rosea]AXE19675.1 hypothetical protein DR864_19005 [Runella rosea]
MKAITLVVALCLLSTAAFSIGRPHNIFATHKAMTERTVVSQPQKTVIPQGSILKNVTQRAQDGVEETRQAVSTVGRIVSFIIKITH